MVGTAHGPSRREQGCGPGSSRESRRVSTGWAVQGSERKVTKVLSPSDSRIPSGAVASDAEAVPGNSGGPLVSQDGVVLGVAVESVMGREGQGTQRAERVGPENRKKADDALAAWRRTTARSCA